MKRIIFTEHARTVAAIRVDEGFKRITQHCFEGDTKWVHLLEMASLSLANGVDGPSWVLHRVGLTSEVFLQKCKMEVGETERRLALMGCGLAAFPLQDPDCITDAILLHAWREVLRETGFSQAQTIIG